MLTFPAERDGAGALTSDRHLNVGSGVLGSDPDQEHPSTSLRTGVRGVGLLFGQPQDKMGSDEGDTTSN
ncbi:MAG: hypothetical protein ABSF91_04060 [Bacteroidota bacterium]